MKYLMRILGIIAVLLGFGIVSSFTGDDSSSGGPGMGPSLHSGKKR